MSILLVLGVVVLFHVLIVSVMVLTGWLVK